MNSPSTSGSSTDSSTELARYKYGSTLSAVATTGEDQEDAVIDIKPPLSKMEQLLNHVTTSLGLVLLTYLGVTLRIYLSYFSLWDGILHFPSIWAQIIGTAIIGFLIGHKDWLQTQHGILYTSLATGLCGSLTTFSSWNAEASIVLLQINSTSLGSLPFANHSTGAVAFLTVLLLGVGMPVTALTFGRNVAQMTFHFPACCFNGRQQPSLPECHFRWKYQPLAFAVVGYIVTTACVVIGCTLTFNYYFLFSLLLGGFGTYIRWRLASLDSRLKSGFPFGTFLANSIGSAILAGALVAKAYVAMETKSSELVNYVLSGVITGFCGSLTTVSTFASQLVKLPFGLGVLYALTSLGVAQVLFTAILGTYSWTN